MANERLRAAINRAGLDADQLAALVEVDVKTVRRWISEGRTPYERHRTRVARALGREQRDLWPDATVDAPPHDPRREIVAAFAHSSDLRAPDWRAMLRDAVEQIDLLDYSLIEIVSAAGVTDLLAAKAAAGCSVRVLIAGIDSLWVTSAACQLGQDDATSDETTFNAKSTSPAATSSP
jgi:transcriptional regulator with XRE-family HTH domain